MINTNAFKYAAYYKAKEEDEKQKFEEESKLRQLANQERQISQTDKQLELQEMRDKEAINQNRLSNLYKEEDLSLAQKRENRLAQTQITELEIKRQQLEADKLKAKNQAEKDRLDRQIKEVELAIKQEQQKYQGKELEGKLAKQQLDANSKLVTQKEEAIKLSALNMANGIYHNSAQLDNSQTEQQIIEQLRKDGERDVQNNVIADPNRYVNLYLSEKSNALRSFAKDNETWVNKNDSSDVISHQEFMSRLNSGDESTADYVSTELSSTKDISNAEFKEVRQMKNDYLSLEDMAKQYTSIIRANPNLSTSSAEFIRGIDNMLLNIQTLVNARMAYNGHDEQMLYDKDKNAFSLDDMVQDFYGVNTSELTKLESLEVQMAYAMALIQNGNRPTDADFNNGLRSLTGGSQRASDIADNIDNTVAMLGRKVSNKISDIRDDDERERLLAAIRGEEVVQENIGVADSDLPSQLFDVFQKKNITPEQGKIYKYKGKNWIFDGTTFVEQGTQ